MSGFREERRRESYFELSKNRANQKGSIAALRRLVEFYVSQLSSVLHNVAFEGQTPDEMYFETGDNIPEQLASARLKARQARLEENRRLNCESCEVEKLMVVNE